MVNNSGAMRARDKLHTLKHNTKFRKSRVKKRKIDCLKSKVHGVHYANALSGGGSRKKMVIVCGFTCMSNEHCIWSKVLKQKRSKALNSWPIFRKEKQSNPYQIHEYIKINLSAT